MAIEYDTVDEQEAVKRAVDMIERIRPILAGAGPAAQGAALVELTAQWVCGHHPASCRPAILEAHRELIEDMVNVMGSATQPSVQ